MQIVECSMINFFVIHSRVALLQVLEPSNEFLGDAIAAVDGDNCRPLFVTTLQMRRMTWRMSFLPSFLIEWSPQNYGGQRSDENQKPKPKPRSFDVKNY